MEINKSVHDVRKTSVKVINRQLLNKKDEAWQEVAECRVGFSSAFINTTSLSIRK
jgi:hypothetical protein